MRLHELNEGLDANQKRAGQVAGEESAKAVGPVLGNKQKQHPFKGRLVGEDTINEFAPSNGDGGEEDNLHKYARMWYNGDLGTQQQVEQILDRMGWEIGEIESEEGGAFVVRSGDENGNSYIGFAVEDLTEGVAEGKEDLVSLRAKAKEISDKIDAIVKDGGRVGLDDPLSRQLKAIRAKMQQAKKQGVAEGNNEKIADRYDQDEWDEKMQHLKKLAGLGPLKTVWDPVKRVYKNVPVNQEKK